MLILSLFITNLIKFPSGFSKRYGFPLRLVHLIRLFLKKSWKLGRFIELLHNRLVRLKKTLAV